MIVQVETEWLPLKCSLPTSQLGIICYSAFYRCFLHLSSFLGIFKEKSEMAQNAREAFSPLKTHMKRDEENCAKQPPRSDRQTL